MGAAAPSLSEALREWGATAANGRRAMRNQATWQPSKYVERRGRIRPSKDTEELAISSRLVASLVGPRVEQNLRSHARGRLLDLGCGKAPFYFWYRGLVSHITCIDWPVSLHGADHVDAYCDLSRLLPIKTGSFDTVLSSDVLEHLPDPDLAVSEIGRVLRPGAKLILNSPFMYPLHEEPADYCRHTRYSLERLVRRGGMEVLQIEEIGGAGVLMADVMAKGALRLPAVGRPTSIAIQGLAGSLVSVRNWRKPPSISSAKLPIAHLLVAQKGG